MYLPLLLLTATLTSALQPRDILKPRNWDMRLLKPGCSANASNIDISIFHRSGIGATDCEALDTSLYNSSSVESLSWKSPGVSRYDLCMYPDGGCGGVAVGEIRDGWEVCFPFSGWEGWRVVEGGVEC